MRVRVLRARLVPTIGPASRLRSTVEHLSVRPLRLRSCYRLRRPVRPPHMDRVENPRNVLSLTRRWNKGDSNWPLSRGRRFGFRRGEARRSSRMVKARNPASRLPWYAGVVDFAAVALDGQVRNGLFAGGSRLRTLGPSPRARMSSVVAFMRATRGPRACKFPVRRRFRAGAECGLGSLRCHLTPLRCRPILELCQCNMRPCARRAAAGPAGDRVYRCPRLNFDHFLI